MLSERREWVLNVLVSDYITTATPVGSEAIVRKYSLGVSPATIRNEMAYLEGEGFITHPHTSAGRIPADKGYRYYVEATPEQPLAFSEQEAIRQQLLRVARDVEELVHLAAALLARAAHNVALVTPPQAPVPRYKHLELVPLNDLVVLLLLVLNEAQVRRQALTLDEPLSQEQLMVMANRLNAALQGMTAAQIRGRLAALSPAEVTAARAVMEMLEVEEVNQREEAHLEGLRNLLAQPEFSESSRVLALLDVLEDRQARRDLLAGLYADDAVRVAIGSENRVMGIEDCSVVVMRYGIPGLMTGTLAVLGPTRMAYPRVIAAIRYLSALMSGLIAEQYPT